MGTKFVVLKLTSTFFAYPMLENILSAFVIHIWDILHLVQYLSFYSPHPKFGTMGGTLKTHMPFMSFCDNVKKGELFLKGLLKILHGIIHKYILYSLDLKTHVFHLIAILNTNFSKGWMVCCTTHWAPLRWDARSLKKCMLRSWIIL